MEICTYVCMCVCLYIYFNDCVKIFKFYFNDLLLKLEWPLNYMPLPKIMFAY